MLPLPCLRGSREVSGPASSCWRARRESTRCCRRPATILTSRIKRENSLLSYIELQLRNGPGFWPDIEFTIQPDILTRIILSRYPVS